MPIHFAPVIRALEEAEESNGLIPTLNSDGVDDILAAESAGTRTKVVPVGYKFILRGTVYTPS